MKPKVNYPAILTFYVIATLFRYITNHTAFLNSIPDEFLKLLFQGLGPAVGALVAIVVFKSQLLLTLKGNYKKLIVPFAIFWVLPAVLILSVEYFTNGTLSYKAVIAILIYGLLEEIGWRGFLRQELKPLPSYLNILIVAGLWFVWHLNFELTISNLFFFGILILGSWGIGKVAESTHSLLAVSAFHSLNNFFSGINQVKVMLLAVLLMVWITAIIIKKRQLKNEALI